MKASPMVTSLLAVARRHIILFGAAKFGAGLLVGFALGVYFLPILTAEDGLDSKALAQLEASAERSAERNAAKPRTWLL